MALTERGRNAILGAFVADAAAMGLHWIYDVDKVKELGGSEPEFHAPVDYHQGRQPGQFTHYGDHALVVLESVAARGGLDLDDYRRRYRERFGEGYDGYVDHATKELLASGAGADDNQAGCFAKLPVLVAVLAEDAEFEAKMKAAIRVTHENKQAVRFGLAAACALRAAVRGASAADAVADVCRASPAAEAMVRKVQAADPDMVAFARENGQTCPVPNAFPVALHAALFGGDFKDTVRHSILSGGDTSGRLMLTGALRGATDGVPEDWLARVADRAAIEALLAKLG